MQRLFNNSKSIIHRAGALRLAALAFALVFCCAFQTGCAFIQTDRNAASAVPSVLASVTPTAFATQSVLTPTPSPSSGATQQPSPTQEPSAEPTASPAPTAQTATLGFAGDLLLMTGQINTAHDSATDTYDFTDSFRYMRGAFESVDNMLINFEGTLAGAEAGYTEPRPTAPPATEDNPNPRRPMQRFNCPDAIVPNLMALGVDGFSTANNHCVDKGVDGILRTIATMDSYGAFHTGTYASADDANIADIIEINGIRIGFVSMTHSVNGFDGSLSAEQARYMVNRLYNDAVIESRIALCREQGAEFVVVCVHWGEEYQFLPNDVQTRYTARLIEWGADMIVGCHPHVIQPIEWVSGTRDGKSVVVPVAYSLGNLVSNISRGNYGVDVGILFRATLERQSDGTVIVTTIGYTPLLDIAHTVSDGRYLHEVYPYTEDTSALASDVASGLSRALALCVEVIGQEIPLIPAHIGG